MCVCVYIPLYLHPCVFLGMCIYIPMCVSMFQRVCVYICVCVYIPVCVPGTVCLHPCVFLHPCVCLHPCVFQDMCIFVCVGVVSYFCVPDKNSRVKRWCWLTECGLLTKYWLNQKKNHCYPQHHRHVWELCSKHCWLPADQWRDVALLSSAAGAKHWQWLCTKHRVCIDMVLQLT